MTRYAEIHRISTYAPNAAAMMLPVPVLRWHGLSQGYASLTVAAEGLRAISRQNLSEGDRQLKHLSEKLQHVSSAEP